MTENLIIKGNDVNYRIFPYGAVIIEDTKGNGLFHISRFDLIELLKVCGIAIDKYILSLKEEVAKGDKQVTSIPRTNLSLSKPPRKSLTAKDIEDMSWGKIIQEYKKRR